MPRKYLAATTAAAAPARMPRKTNTKVLAVLFPWGDLVTSSREGIYHFNLAGPALRYAKDYTLTLSPITDPISVGELSALHIHNVLLPRDRSALIRRPEAPRYGPGSCREGAQRPSARPFSGMAERRNRPGDGSPISLTRKKQTCSVSC